MGFRAALPLALLLFPASADASYYVSLGDSWAQGVQQVNGVDRPTDRGFSDVLYRKLRRTHPRLKLVKLGCRAATTATMIHGQKRCGVDVPYGSGSQLAYAKRFLRTHDVKYVTVIIGGNEVWRCNCAGDIAENLPRIARTLRAAAPHARIVGSTYADILLGEYAKGDRDRAERSVTVFKREVNPVMQSAYAASGIGFVDATAGFGGYRPLADAAAQICRYAYSCESDTDVHLNARGYRRLARLIERKIR